MSYIREKTCIKIYSIVLLQLVNKHNGYTEYHYLKKLEPHNCRPTYLTSKEEINSFSSYNALNSI